jgi:hypothetical protein
MPEYLFQNKTTGEVKSIFQKMREPHTYEEGGVEWKRLFTVPQASMDTKVDPFSKTKFLEKTNNAQTVGDLWDRSADLSRQRAAQSDTGVDPVKAAAVKKMKKERRGKGGDRE